MCAQRQDVERKLFPTALNVMGSKIAFLYRTCCSAFWVGFFFTTESIQTQDDYKKQSWKSRAVPLSSHHSFCGLISNKYCASSSNSSKLKRSTKLFAYWKDNLSCFFCCSSLSDNRASPLFELKKQCQLLLSFPFPNGICPHGQLSMTEPTPSHSFDLLSSKLFYSALFPVQST